MKCSEKESESLPLNGAGRFGADVIDNSINPLHLIDDTVGDLAEQVIWQMGPVCRHGILAFHTAQCDDA